MTEPWVQTLSGQAIDILEPRAPSMRLADIAASLSCLARFNGHTHTPWSVASHSLLAEQLLPHDVDAEARLFVLLHDAHEMVTGDVVTPFKIALAECAGFDIVAYLARQIQSAIHLAAGVRCDARMRELCKLVDLKALAIEKRDLLSPEPRPWGLPLPDVSKIPRRIIPETQMLARDRFISRCRTLIHGSDVVPMASFLEGTSSASKGAA